MECRVLPVEILRDLHRLCSIPPAYTVPHEKMAIAHSLKTVTTSDGISSYNVLLTNLLMDSTITQISLVNKLTPYFFKIHFNIILPLHVCLKSGFLSVLFTKIVKTFLTIISCYDS
jgi:hypothetical protein